jgi:hypothetical protein
MAFSVNVIMNFDTARHPSMKGMETPKPVENVDNKSAIDFVLMGVYFCR